MLNQGLIGLLECPVCMEYMGPPIHQCRRGHLVCSACKPKLPSCPTCRSRFTESRNLAMEKVGVNWNVYLCSCA
jgi:E3 ubiquitin-protein ligase SIAH1